MKNKKYLLLILSILCILISVNQSIFSKETASVTTDSFMAGELTKSSTASPEEVFYGYLDANKTKFGLNSAAKNHFKILRKGVHPDGGTILKLQQTFLGIPIFNGIMKAHVRQNGVLDVVSGKTIPGLDKFPMLTKAATLTKNAVADIATVDLSKSCTGTFNITQSGLYIYQINQEPRLVYFLELRPELPQAGRWLYFIDAFTGQILDKSNAIIFDYPATGSGQGVLGDTKTLNVKYESAKNRYIMVDETRSYGTISTNIIYDTGADYANYPVPYFYRAIEYSAVDAHYYSGKVLDYFKNAPYNRNGYNNNNATVNIYTNSSGLTYNNAGWDGAWFVYGATDGTKYLPFSGAIECVAHEFTHALSESEAQWQNNYKGETGAINEAFSDIFGALVESYYNYADPWISCEDIYTPNIAGDALRSLSNPPSCSFNDGTGSKPYPAHYNNYYTGTYDNQGVHINSNIINKAGYLISQGGTNNGYTITGIGPAKTGWIFYRTLCDYVLPNETFNDLYNHILQETVNLYGTGSAEWTAVKNAFNSVGIPKVTQPTYGPFGRGSGGNGLQCNEVQLFHENLNDVEVYVNGISLAVVWADLYKKQGTSWVKCGTTHSCTSGPMTWYGVGPGDYKLEIHYVYQMTVNGYCTYTIH